MDGLSPEWHLPQPSGEVIVEIPGSEKKIKVTFFPEQVKRDCIEACTTKEHELPGTYNIALVKKIAGSPFVTTDKKEWEPNFRERAVNLDDAQGAVWVSRNKKGVPTAIEMFVDPERIIKMCLSPCKGNPEAVARMAKIILREVYHHELGHFIDFLRIDFKDPELTPLEKVAPTLIKIAGYAGMALSCSLFLLSKNELGSVRYLGTFVGLSTTLSVAEIWGRKYPGSGKYWTEKDRLEEAARKFEREKEGQEQKAFIIEVI